MKSTPPGPVQVKAGEFIIAEGDPGKDMYIIEQGQVEIVKSVGAGMRRLGVLEAGDFFGEMAILDDQPRGASARAVKDAKLLRIDASTFDQMLRQYPEIAIRMLRKLSARLREASANPEIVRSETTTTGPGAPAPSEAPVTPRPAAAPKSAGEAGGSGRLICASSGTELALPKKDDIKIGRFDQVTGIHPDIDLTTLDTNKMTSRRHARILRQGSKTQLCEDIGTPNGTFVNAVRIQTGVPVEIKDGDRIRFGDVEMTFRAG